MEGRKTGDILSKVMAAQDGMSLKKCPACSNFIQSDARFCAECGHKLK
ncbi:MAG: hypothetical protein CVU77_04340 [Elusimicrobia bacterium HGW-Elusimicrobia-1]|jgi:rRNA maturation endonuclease Nob1|nr:MAG: hypothetical protein CVU77_04340 [Elusimicrobia bacterium HGW-Elusimicrobia-1]